MRRLALCALLALASCKASPPEKVSPTPEQHGLDPALLQRYVDYEKALVSVLGTLASATDAGGLADRIDTASAQVQRASGLTPEQLHAWESLTVDIFRLQPPQQPGAREKISPEGAPDALAEPRRTYGSPAVDAVLAREAELYDLHLKRAELLKRLTSLGGG